MSVSPPPFLTGATAESMFDRIAAKMRAAGFPTDQGTPDHAIAYANALLVYDWTFAAAARLHQDQFIATATPWALDRHGEHYGLPRLAATPAQGTVTFDGIDDTIIPAGTLVTTAAQFAVPAVSFATLAEVVIGETVSGEVTVAAEAVTAGSRGNVLAGAIRFLANPIAGVANVHNDEAAVGGS